MTKGKTVYLWAIIILFIIIIIPFFQNIATGGGDISFYFISTSNIISIYLWILTFGMVEGVLITLYVQSLIKDIKDQEIQKFDLDK